MLEEFVWGPWDAAAAAENWGLLMGARRLARPTWADDTILTCCCKRSMRPMWMRAKGHMHAAGYALDEDDVDKCAVTTMVGTRWTETQPSQTNMLVTLRNQWGRGAAAAVHEHRQGRTQQAFNSMRVLLTEGRIAAWRRYRSLQSGVLPVAS